VEEKVRSVGREGKGIERKGEREGMKGKQQNTFY
jgi:hypothetical protein